MQLEDSSIKSIRGKLRHLLEWADSTPFPEVKDKSPIFPVYLLKARNDGKNDQLAPTTLKKACENTRSFFDYARQEWPVRYKPISAAWVNTIRPARSKGTHTVLKQHEYYSLEDMLKIANSREESTRELRDKAAACFLFLSGMRADAFISMPIKAVNWKTYQVKQLPEIGVRTKNRKAGITTLLPIPELIQVCQDWNKRLIGLPDNSLWYASIATDAETIIPKVEASAGRRMLLSKGINKLSQLSEIDYKSLHKFRHGHVVYALSRVKDMAGLKAVSQNVMHSSVGITDSIYGNLVSDDVHNVISGINNDMSGKTKEVSDLENLIPLLNNLLNNPELLKGLNNLKN